MERSIQPGTALPFAPLRAPERLCHIECQGCGTSADVALEFFVPASLELRCLACGHDHVRVTEPGRDGD